MRATYLLIGAALLFTGAVACAYLSWSTPIIGDKENLGELVAENPEIAFGEIEPGVDRTASFDLTNRGTSTLTIVHVLPSCQCSQAAIARRELGPGEATALHLTWKPPAGRRGRQAIVIPVLYRNASEDKEKSLLLRVTGDVQGDLRFSTEHLLFTSGLRADAEISIRSHANRFHVTGVSADHPCLHALWQPERGAARVVFIAQSWDANGDTSVHIVVDTDNPNEPRIYLPVEIRPGAVN